MRFRTVYQPLYTRWDMQFLLTARRHARCVWVRVPGLLRYWTIDDFALLKRDCRAVQDWESCMTSLSLGGRPAFVYLSSNAYPSQRRPGGAGPRAKIDERTLREWPQFLWHAYRLQRMLTILARETGKPVGVHVEDWSARWVLDSTFRPAMWCMDNPFVPVQALCDRYAAHLQVPTLLRHSELALPPFRTDYWRLPFGVEQLPTAGLPVRGRHGVWRGGDRGRAARPLEEWLRPHPDYRPPAVPL